MSTPTGSPGAPLGRLVLLFPPLSHLITQPEFGPGAVAGYARRAGLDVTIADLNNRFLYKYLRRPRVLSSLLRELSPAARRRLARLPGQLAAREQSARRALSACEPREAERLLRRYLDQLGGVLSEVVEREDGAPAGESDAASSFLSLAGDGAVSWPLWARFADLIGEDLVQPKESQAAALAEAAERPCPLLDRFLEEFLDPLLEPAPRLLGLSIHNYRQLVVALRIARRARARLPSVHVVAGGPWCRAGQDLLREEPFVFRFFDSVVPEAGELPVAALARALADGTALSRVPGLLLLQDGKVAATAAPPPLALEDLPAPLFAAEDLALYPEPRLPFHTSRGCYWNRCTFCYHVTKHRPEIRPMTARHLRVVVDYVRDARDRLGIEKFSVADHEIPPAHLAQVSKAFIDARLGVRWQTMARFDPGFTDAHFKLAAAAGCQEVSFGLETSSPEGLRRVNKGITLETIMSCLRGCAAAGIDTSLFVVNYPSQSLAEYEDTLRFARDNRGIIGHVMPLRFELGRNSIVFRSPRALGLTIPENARTAYDVFDLPFEAESFVDSATFGRVTEQRLLEFLSAPALRHAS